MNIYPGSFTKTLHVHAPQRFWKRLRRLSENTIHLAKDRTAFVGRVKRNRFTLARKQDYYKAFRPTIRGRLYGERLELSVGASTFALQLIVGMWAFLALAFVLTRHWWCLVTALIVTGVWYVVGWLLFAVELRNVRRAVERHFEQPAAQS